MKKFKLKELIKVFLILLIIQFFIGLADVLLSQANNDLSKITAILISICSFPLKLINSDLPFFVSESLVMKGIYWMINLIIQSVFVYAILIVIKKLRSEK